ncbi:MAG: ATP-binding protein [Sandaracinaceae bacterium]
MATRRVTALALGVVLATLLLGGGWLRATLRDRDARMSDARGQLERRADLVRAAVDESLEELRAREDERPFYLYNHFYSPPDVLAISDPVARSPLAQTPSDIRWVGHFQIDPEGAVQTPYDADGDTLSALGAQIGESVRSPALAPLRALATGDGPSLLQPSITPAEPATPAAAVVPVRRPRRIERPEIERPETEPDADVGRVEEPSQPGDGTLEETATEGRSDQETQDDGNADGLGVEAPLTVGLNAWSNVQARDIVAAQGGDVNAGNRLLERGRQVPRISRRNVDWSDTEAAAPSTPATPSNSGRSSGAGQRQRRRRPTPPTVPADPMPVQDGVGASLELDNLVQREAEVTYTSMVYRDQDGLLVLHRLVTHEGVSVVQGLLFDRDRLVASWIPALVARHADEGAALRVVSSDADAPVDDTECAVRRPASRILAGVDLCFGPSALMGTSRRLDEELHYQVGGLVGLWLLVLLAAFAIIAAARRAEALSRQKSAFVSAVSHELRTPLTTLRMHAEMLDGELVTEDRRPKVHRELVQQSVRLARLVENVLSLSKLEEGRRTLRLDEADLSAHVAGVVEGQRGFVEEKGFTLTFEGPEGLRARFDAQAVEQIVVNLIDNALKYAVGDEQAIELKIEHDGAPSIVARDRGPGIPEAERDRVFERFHRVERPEHAHAPGTGIGLSLVRELAEAHGGKATAHGREGGGLELRVTLA